MKIFVDGVARGDRIRGRSYGHERIEVVRTAGGDSCFFLPPSLHLQRFYLAGFKLSLFIGCPLGLPHTRPRHCHDRNPVTWPDLQAADLPA